ncbi:MAG: DUF3179 domain-containing protein [Chloroflexi bacterium]|nr:DUF3179 domain-containing protein [Chloroflexota bacterium]
MFLPQPQQRVAALTFVAFVAILTGACGDVDAPKALSIEVPGATATLQSDPPPTAQPVARREFLDENSSDSPDPTIDAPFTITERPFVTRSRFEGWQTNFSRRVISLDELGRMVPRDTIPAISNPSFTPVGDVIASIDPREPVIAVEVNGDARAYPLDILLQHEIVNDDIGGVPIVVTYCPLCNSAVAFERTVGGTVREFGVSGFLRLSDLVMYDNVTETMWQQITGEGLVGDDAGTFLTAVPVQTVSFGTFVDRFSDGAVLDRPDVTGFDYDTAPYAGYDDAENVRPFLFFETFDRRLPVIERVSAVDIGTGPVAYAFSFLDDNPVVNDLVGDAPVVVFFDDKTRSGFVSSNAAEGVNIAGSSSMFFREFGDQTLTFTAQPDGTITDTETGSTWDRFGLATSGELVGHELLPVIHGDHFWFAWAAFKPDTRLVTMVTELIE